MRMSTQAALAAITGIMANPSTKVFDQNGTMMTLPLGAIASLAHQIGIAYENRLAADWQSAINKEPKACANQKPKVEIEDELPF